MDEIWERAVALALDGNLDTGATRSLTLDGAVKCFQGRLPPPNLLGRFENLDNLSIANIGLTTLEQFPRLRNLQKLVLSDNRIAGGLEFLVEAGLESLRDLDLSNNRVQYIEDLAPLAQLRLVSLDLYECPVTRVKDYRSRVFGLIRSLKYLDKMDAEENERPESDEEEEDEEEIEEDDPGSGEIDGEDRPYNNGHSVGCEGVVDEDEESDADEEEAESSRRVNGGSSNHTNGFHVSRAVDAEDEDEDDDDDEEDGEDADSGEEIDEDGDEDVVEIHEIIDSDDDDDDDDDGVEDDDEEEGEEGDLAEPESTGRLTGIEGEIDGHEQGEDDDHGETGEEEQGIEDDGEFEDDEGEEEEDYGAGYLVQPVGQAGGGRFINEEEDSEEEEVEDVRDLPSSSLHHLKRKRDVDSDDDDDDDGNCDGGEEDGKSGYTIASKKQQ